jgi:hypothetical protein
MNNRICGICPGIITRANNNVIYCDSCYNNRKNDICEYIDSNGISHYITKGNISNFPTLIGSKPIQIRLDLHGALDLVSSDVIFRDANICCCISYVGSTTKTRLLAKKEILSRLGKQISCGFIIFKRGRGKTLNTFYDVGGKAWINDLIPIDLTKKAIFVDDSDDHINSVVNKQINGLTAYLMREHDDLLKVISDYF